MVIDRMGKISIKSSFFPSKNSYISMSNIHIGMLVKRVLVVALIIIVLIPLMGCIEEPDTESPEEPWIIYHSGDLIKEYQPGLVKGIRINLTVGNRMVAEWRSNQTTWYAVFEVSSGDMVYGEEELPTVAFNDTTSTFVPRRTGEYSYGWIGSEEEPTKVWYSITVYAF